MPFIYHRRVHFQDTDAAGVVYFANVFSICHEAYEASLVASEISLRDFFSNSTCAVPIVESSAKFFRPMYCGDELKLSLTPTSISSSEFSITYAIAVARTSTEKDADQYGDAALAFTRHVAIAPNSRKRCPLPANLLEWLDRWS